MESRDDEVVVGCDAFRIYRSGKMDRLHRPERVPAGLNPATGVTSKDVVLDAGTGLSARLFLPRLGARGSVISWSKGLIGLIGASDIKRANNVPR